MFGKDFSSVCGNRSLTSHIKSEIRRGTLGHAYIIEGDEGAGKESFAECFAAGLICEGNADSLPCGECSVCKKLIAGSHPDVKFVDSEGKASVGVDIIRNLRADAHVIPSEAERKIYIIKGADTMTEQAQNAFLLSLEEPPSYVTYLLLCKDASRLLDTIRSRAPSLRLSPASPDELREFILQNRSVRDRYSRLNSEEKAELTVCAAGNAGRALRLLEGTALADRTKEKRDALDFLSSLLSGDGEAYITVSDMKKLKRDSASLLLDDMTAALRDMLVFKKVKSAGTVFFTDAASAVAAASSYSAKKLAFTLDAVTDTKKRVCANAQVTSALLALAVRTKQINQ